MSTGARLGILAGIIVVAIVALVIASGGGDDNTAPAATTVTVKNAKPVGGIQKVKVNKGDQVKLVVRSDTADEIHIHGYDFHKDVAAGGSVSFSFPAKIDGNFEIELENHKEQIAELTVEP